MPGDGANGSFVDYPYFYILIPGVLFVVVIAVIIIVIFKKLCERNKGSVGFVRGEEGRGERKRERKGREVRGEGEKGEGRERERESKGRKRSEGRR